MLLQQRARKKYHSGGLWTNACCSHPRPGEATRDAAMRRLEEELGFRTELDKLFAFTYRTAFDNGLTEFEYDHVFAGFHDREIRPDPHEVDDYCYVAPVEIEASLSSHPLNYTVWFRQAFPLVQQWLAENPEWRAAMPLIRKGSGSPY
jgi:isopentenyl-diphosphate delta-isomerase